MCPLRGDGTRGLAPFVGIGEAGFRAEPMTGRRLQTSLARSGGSSGEASLHRRRRINPLDVFIACPAVELFRWLLAMG